MVAVALLLIVGSSVVTFLIADARRADEGNDLRDAEIRSCEDKKADRVDNAKGWGEVRRSVTSRSHDPNLPASERRRAHHSAKVYVGIQARLRSRVYLCGPYVRDKAHIIDRGAFR